MMYLVLIAMLVLNVDKRILKSFHLMETNIIGSSMNLDAKNELIMGGFLSNLKNDPEKTEPYFEKAKEARAITKEFNEYIESIKTDIEDLYGGRVPDEEEDFEDPLVNAMVTPEKMEEHAHYFMVENQGKRATELKQKINETRDKLLSLLKPDEDGLFTTDASYLAVSEANRLFAEDPQTAGPKKLTWENINLEQQPAGALMALLSQLQFNAKSLESDILTKLADQIHLFDYKIDKITAEILPQSNYVMEGESYQAKVMLVASNSNPNYEIIVNGRPWDDIVAGVGQIDLPASGVGERTVEGYILVPNPKNNKPDTFDYRHTYQVFKPVATVALDKMNLLYTEIDNPVSISVPGFSAADIQVRVSAGARITGGNGNYNITVDGSQRKIAVTVVAKGKVMGITEYRVRKVPDPRLRYGGLFLNGSPIAKERVAAQTKLLAFLGDDFAYDLRWQITDATVYFLYKNREPGIFRIRNGNIPNDLRQTISRAKTGEKVLVDVATAYNAEFNITKRLTEALLITLN